MYQKNLSDILELASSRIYLSQLMPRMTWKNWLFEKFAISWENEVETTWKHHPKLEEHVWHQIRSKKVKNHRRNHLKSRRIQLTGHVSNFVVAILKSKRSQSRKLLWLIIFAWKKNYPLWNLKIKSRKSCHDPNPHWVHAPKGFVSNFLVNIAGMFEFMGHH